MNSLFVPLKQEYFEDFLVRGKRFELRRHGPQYTTRNVRPGREVELRNGWSGHQAIYGRVGRVEVGTLAEIVERVELASIEPRQSCQQEYRSAMQSDGSKYIAFEILEMRVGPTVFRGKGERRN